MSHQFKKTKKGGGRGGRGKKKRQPVGLMDLPENVMLRVLAFLDEDSLEAMSAVSQRSHNLVNQVKAAEGEKGLQLVQLPTEVLTLIASHLGIKDLGRLAQVNKRFKDVVGTEMTWSASAKECLVTNGQSAAFLEQTGPFPIWSSKDKVRVAHNWTSGHYKESHLAVQNIRYMPRVQLQRSTLWVSWGKHIWSHPRRKDGSVHNTTNKVFKGHTDDVSKFVVKDGCLISGGRDRALFGWNADTGEFMFAKRYCHGSEISAVDIMRSSGLIVTGSRDKTVKVWTLDSSYGSSGDSSGGSADERPYEPPNPRGRAFPTAVNTLSIGDRVWSLAADPIGQKVVVGTAGTMGIPSLHVIDLETLRGGSSHQHQPMWLELGHGLKNGAGCLDVHWQSPHCFLSCGHDACTRLWDLRVPSGSNCNVVTWEEPFNEAIYSLATDGCHSLLTGTARHGLARLWDMRSAATPVNHYYVKHPFVGASSPVYSVAFDQRHMYAALDQSVNLLSFSGYKTRPAHPTITPPSAF